MNRLVCAAAIVSLMAAVVAGAWAEDGEGWQARYRLGTALDLGDCWEAGIFREYRVGGSPNGLEERITEAGLTWRPGRWVRLGLSYRQADKIDGEEWVLERRRHVHATLHAKRWGLGISDRSRLERRRWESGEKSWRYRNMLKVTMPPAWLASIASPYVALEGFYAVDDDEYNQTRLFAGAKGGFTQLLTVDVYYLHQTQKSGDGWSTRHAVGLRVTGRL